MPEHRPDLRLAPPGQVVCYCHAAVYAAPSVWRALDPDLRLRFGSSVSEENLSEAPVPTAG